LKFHRSEILVIVFYGVENCRRASADGKRKEKEFNGL